MMKSKLNAMLSAIAVTVMAAFFIPAGASAARCDTLGHKPAGECAPDLGVRVDSLLMADMFETSAVGLMIYDLTADSVLYSHNARQRMRPASTLKMMVTVAALDCLGHDYRYATRLYLTGRTTGRTHTGDLYCKGGFDPMLSHSDLIGMAESLKRLGIDTLRGNIYTDLTMTADEKWGEGWCWDDDNPTLSPLLVDGKEGFVERFMDCLSRAGIYFNGGTAVRPTPPDAAELCAIYRPVGDVLPRLMKDSDNLYSESLFYLMTSAADPSRPATAKRGRELMGRLITRLGLKASDYYIADGSGLSLYNYVSPELEVAFLRYAYANDRIYVPLYQVMPVAGIDGTLEKRMKEGFARGNVHAKTGTVTGVSALAGYCTAANGHTLCFSIINMGIRRAAIGRTFQDALCEALCRP